MTPDVLAVASSTGVCLLVLVLVWARFRRPQVPPSLRRTYTATATYIAETIVQPSQATNLVFPAPSLRKVHDIVPTIFRDFSGGREPLQGGGDPSGSTSCKDESQSAEATTSDAGLARSVTDIRPSRVRGLRQVLRVEPVRFVPDSLVGSINATPRRLRTPSPPVAGPSQPTTQNAPATSRPQSPLTPLSSPSPSPPPPARLIRTFSTKTELVLSLERNDHVSGTVIDDNGEEAVIMSYWWETTSDDPITYPLDLSCRPELQEGDLFLHRIPGRKPVMWLWTRNPEGGLHWKSVYVGYVREDGRRLALTKTRVWPTWLQAEWYIKQRRQ